MTGEDCLIEARDLSIGYDGKALISGINFQLHRGDYTAIIGPNGGGKTTLLKTILGLLPKVSGVLKNCYRKRGAGGLGYVPQRETFDLLYPLTGFQVAMQGRYPLIGVGRRERQSDREKVQEILARMKVVEVAHHPFRDLSGGQKQRVLIARALACQPTLLVLDEPTANMDMQGECDVIAILEELRCEQHITILVVSHFLSSLRGRVQSVLVCNGERNRFEVRDADSALDPDAVGRLFSGHTAEEVASRIEKHNVRRAHASL